MTPRWFQCAGKVKYKGFGSNRTGGCTDPEQVTHPWASVSPSEKWQQDMCSLLVKQSKLRVIKTQFYSGPGTCSKLPFYWVEWGSGMEDIRAPITLRPTPAVWAQGPPTSCCSAPSKLMKPALSPQGAWLLSMGWGREFMPTPFLNVLHFKYDFVFFFLINNY